MATVHPSALVGPEVELGANVEIGPFCVLDGAVTIGAGTRLLGNNYLQGPLTLGRDNLIYPFACLGFAPQSRGYDPAEGGSGVEIGDGNLFREHATVHRATGETPTRIGNENFIMVSAHVAHDAQVGNRVVMANATLLAGHVRVDDGAVLGGGVAVHQFCRIGRSAMLSGATGAPHDVPPFFMLTGLDVCAALNLVALRRSGMSKEDIGDVKWVFRTIYAEGITPAERLAALGERAHRPVVAEYIDFLKTSRRGITPGRSDKRRGG